MQDLRSAALGIDLGGSSIKWGIVRRDGSVLAEDVIALNSRAPGDVIEAIARPVREALQRKDYKLTGVGIGSPGLIDATRTSVRLSPNFPDWKNVPLAASVKLLAGADVPVLLENDANVLVYSETRWGAAFGMKHVVVLTLGTGVGGGVMVDGKLLRGVNGGAGELGHIPLDVNGPACGTGVKGSFEAYCSIDGVMREANQIYRPGKPPASPDELTRAADSGDARAIEVWRRIGFFLGAGVAACINVFNPQAVLIGGGIAGAGEHLMEPARRTARSRCFAPNWDDCLFTRAGLQYRAGMLGAAAMAFDHAGVETIPGDG